MYIICACTCNGLRMDLPQSNSLKGCYVLPGAQRQSCACSSSPSWRPCCSKGPLMALYSWETRKSQNVARYFWKYRSMHAWVGHTKDWKTNKIHIDTCIFMCILVCIPHMCTCIYAYTRCTSEIYTTHTDIFHTYIYRQVGMRAGQIFANITCEGQDPEPAAVPGKVATADDQPVPMAPCHAMVQWFNFTQVWCKRVLHCFAASRVHNPAWTFPGRTWERRWAVHDCDVPHVGQTGRPRPRWSIAFGPWASRGANLWVRSTWHQSL